MVAVFPHPVARELENPSGFSLISQGSEEGGAEGDAGEGTTKRAIESLEGKGRKDPNPRG